MQRLRHDVDEQASIVLRTHDLDGQVFQRSFGQISRGAQRIAERTTGSIDVAGRNQ